jgi:hypothetical protein
MLLPIFARFAIKKATTKDGKLKIAHSTVHVPGIAWPGWMRESISGR